ncbi:hypothetical protein HanIR_Chr06g0299501 [Helianthus annuus]|nr:hypothetical protein HanIR_Chr06g0299501 [Helianthus annuus]
MLYIEIQTKEGDKRRCAFSPNALIDIPDFFCMTLDPCAVIISNQKIEWFQAHVYFLLNDKLRKDVLSNSKTPLLTRTHLPLPFLFLQRV